MKSLSLPAVGFNSTFVNCSKFQPRRPGPNLALKIEKLPEGNFSRVFFALTMDDGRDLIAKLPDPNAGQPHLTTASEVAKMDYVSLHFPVAIEAH